MEAVIAKDTNGLVPMLAAMPGFVLYAWLQTADGRTAITSGRPQTSWQRATR